MEIAFETMALRTVCESEVEARRQLGVNAAEALQHRLADLRAAGSIRDLIAGKPRELEGADFGNVAVDLNDEKYMVISANHTSNPVGAGGQLDWARVTRIKILRIESENG